MGARRTSRGPALIQARSIDAMRGSPEASAVPVAIPGGPVWQRVSVADGAICRFSFSTDGAKFRDIGAPFAARQGRWVGAKVGLFARRPAAARGDDHADFDYFRISGP